MLANFTVSYYDACIMSDSKNLDPELLEIFVCPVTRSPLHKEGEYLIGEIGGLKYPIRDGIPVLLAGEAELPEGFDSLDEFRQKYSG